MRAVAILGETINDMVKVLQNDALELSQISEGALANELPHLADALTDDGADEDFMVGVAAFLAAYVAVGGAIVATAAALGGGTGGGGGGGDIDDGGGGDDDNNNGDAGGEGGEDDST